MNPQNERARAAQPGASRARAAKAQAVSRRGLLTGVAGLVGVGAAVALSGCAPAGKPEIVPSDENVERIVTVRVVDNAYSPQDLEITVNTAVRWDFEGSMEHDVVAEDGSFVSPLIKQGDYTHEFTEPGEYPYDCSIHPEMTGVIRVIAE